MSCILGILFNSYYSMQSWCWAAFTNYSESHILERKKESEMWKYVGVGQQNNML